MKVKTADMTTYRREYMRQHRKREDYQEYMKVYNKAYREKNREKLAEANRLYKQRNKEHIKLLNKIERYRLKFQILEHYSVGDKPQCKNCSYSDLRALHLDHINNDGAESRRKLFGSRTVAGEQYYRHLRRAGFPDGYQVLCANCNIIKFHENINGYYPDSPSL